MRFATEMALVALAAPAAHELVEDNYAAWRRRLSLLSMTTGLEWTLMEDPIVSPRFPKENKNKLLALVMTHIRKSLSQPINNRLYFESTDNPKSLLDKIDEILAQNNPVKDKELRQEARRLVCSNDNRGIDQYINGHRQYSP